MRRWLLKRHCTRTACRNTRKSSRRRIQKKNQILEENNGRLQSKLDTYNNYLLPKATKEAKELIGQNHFTGVRIVTWEQWNNQGEKSMNISDIQKCQEEYEKLLKESPIEGVMNKIAKDILNQKSNAMVMEFTGIICDLLKRYGVYVHCAETKLSENITHNSIEEQYGIVFDSMDFSQHDKEFTDKIKELEEELAKNEEKRKNADKVCVIVNGFAKEYPIEEVGEIVRAYEEIKLCKEMNKECKTILPQEYLKVLSLNHTVPELQSEVEKYRKAFEGAKKERDCQVAEYRNRTEKDRTEIERAKNTINQIDDILEKLFGVRHDVGKPDEFEKILAGRVKGNAANFLPTEPIKVADMLINAEGEYEHNPIVKKICGTDKGTYRIFEISELRQIAEHLLVYCNHNKEEEE